MNTIYEYNVDKMNGESVSLGQYEGNVVLIVNTASKCGFTPQFEGLQKLHEEYEDKGLKILGFPCNQFGKQDPGNDEEILSFCQLNYGVSFEMFHKIDVNGENESPLYTFLKSEKKGLFGRDIKWNFTKFLVNKQGTVVKRFGPNVEPAKIVKDIETFL